MRPRALRRSTGKRTSRDESKSAHFVHARSETFPDTPWVYGLGQPDGQLRCLSQVYHPEFRGSHSLKLVLPALAPDMTYEGMEVAECSEAGLAWVKMIRANAESEERRRLKDALLAYRKQDTLAMVRLLDVLQAA